MLGLSYRLLIRSFLSSSWSNFNLLLHKILISDVLVLVNSFPLNFNWCYSYTCLLLKVPFAFKLLCFFNVCTF